MQAITYLLNRVLFRKSPKVELVQLKDCCKLRQGLEGIFGIVVQFMGQFCGSDKLKEIVEERKKGDLEDGGVFELLLLEVRENYLIFDVDSPILFPLHCALFELVYINFSLVHCCLYNGLYSSRFKCKNATFSKDSLNKLFSYIKHPFFIPNLMINFENVF